MSLGPTGHCADRITDSQRQSPPPPLATKDASADHEVILLAEKASYSRIWSDTISYTSVSSFSLEVPAARDHSNGQ